jgi:hypothetical protein
MRRARPRACAVPRGALPLSTSGPRRPAHLETPHSPRPRASRASFGARAPRACRVSACSPPDPARVSYRPPSCVAAVVRAPLDGHLDFKRKRWAMYLMSPSLPSHAPPFSATLSSPSPHHWPAEPSPVRRQSRPSALESPLGPPEAWAFVHCLEHAASLEFGPRRTRRRGLTTGAQWSTSDVDPGYQSVLGAFSREHVPLVGHLHPPLTAAAKGIGVRKVASRAYLWIPDSFRRPACKKYLQ